MFYDASEAYSLSIKKKKSHREQDGNWLSKWKKPISSVILVPAFSRVSILQVPVLLLLLYLQAVTHSNLKLNQPVRGMSAIHLILGQTQANVKVP